MRARSSISRTFQNCFVFYAMPFEVRRLATTAAQINILCTAHQTLYYNFVLHRDVNTDNILICYKDDNVEGSHGCLIDFGHADYADKTKLIDPTPPVPPEAWNARIRRTYDRIIETMVREIEVEPKIDEIVFSALVSQFGNRSGPIVSYVKHVLQDKAHLKGNCVWR